MAEDKVLGNVQEKELPSPTQPEKKVKRGSKKEKPLPEVGNAQNVVEIGGKKIEIRPTKLKYHRNNTAYFYRILRNVPLPDIMAFPAGTFGDDRDGDKALMDWLIAATDDEELILQNYNDMDTETIESILAAFMRVNHIEEKEAAQKNAVSQGEKE